MRYDNYLQINVFTFKVNGDCEDFECNNPKVDIDSEGRVIIHYEINGSPEVWTSNENFNPETWYEIEIKQYEKNGEVLNIVLLNRS